MKEAEVNPIITDEKIEEVPTEELPTKRITGRIIKLGARGWGFISSAEHPFTRIFFHWSDLNPKLHFLSLKKGMNLSFECAIDEEKGLRAFKIDKP
jgi:cold shock CspA family protein